MTEDLIAYNIIPLDAPSTANLIGNFPEKDNVSNQREHVVHLLANEQSQLVKLEASDPKLHEAAVENVSQKSLDNYSKWCSYLGLQPVWSSFDAVGQEKKLVFLSLYFLIWGEAANIQFLPECLCYIFHPEAMNNDNGKAPHSCWCNYDDFNELFWSLRCFELSWPWRRNAPFFQKPKPRTKRNFFLLSLF